MAFLLVRGPKKLLFRACTVVFVSGFRPLFVFEYLPEHTTRRHRVLPRSWSCKYVSQESGACRLENERFGERLYTRSVHVCCIQSHARPLRTFCKYFVGFVLKRYRRTGVVQTEGKKMYSDGPSVTGIRQFRVAFNNFFKTEINMHSH